MIKLSVALPVFNSKKIAWLAMESLCRQKNVDFLWELVVAEENTGEFCGEKFFKGYEERLKKVAGTLKYIKLTQWIPLFQKWKLIASQTAQTSRTFILQAADCYSEPHRLSNTFRYVNKGYDWVQNKKGVFFNIRTHQHIVYEDLDGVQNAGLNMATLTEYMRNLPDIPRRACVDGWIYKSVQPKNKINLFGSECLFGVDTHGLNNISIKREKFFNNPAFPFTKTDLRIESCLPTQISQRLYALRTECYE